MAYNVITEITPLHERDFFYLAEREKDHFDYPLHRHEEIEFNFLENVEGCSRFVGDSVEQCGYYDLVIVGGGLDHTWEQGDCASANIHEVTVQFAADIFPKEFLAKNYMQSLHSLFLNAQRGVAFSQKTIEKVRPKILDMCSEKKVFYRLLKFMEILYDLSVAEDCQVLATPSYSNSEINPESRRVRKVEEYIAEHFRHEIRLQELADLVGMTPSAFSRFFRMRTNKTVSEYIIDMRLGYAFRLLLESSLTIVEICFESGFNNVSNFNRIFKKKKGCSPTEFREKYLRNTIQ